MEKTIIACTLLIIGNNYSANDKQMIGAFLSAGALGVALFL